MASIYILRAKHVSRIIFSTILGKESPPVFSDLVFERKIHARLAHGKEN